MSLRRATNLITPREPHLRNGSPTAQPPSAAESVSDQKDPLVLSPALALAPGNKCCSWSWAPPAHHPAARRRHLVLPDWKGGDGQHTCAAGRRDVGGEGVFLTQAQPLSQQRVGETPQRRLQQGLDNRPQGKGRRLSLCLGLAGGCRSSGKAAWGATGSPPPGRASTAVTAAVRGGPGLQRHSDPMPSSPLSSAEAWAPPQLDHGSS